MSSGFTRLLELCGGDAKKAKALQSQIVARYVRTEAVFGGTRSILDDGYSFNALAARASGKGERFKRKREDDDDDDDNNSEDDMQVDAFDEVVGIEPTPGKRAKPESQNGDDMQVDDSPATVAENPALQGEEYGMVTMGENQDMKIPLDIVKRVMMDVTMIAGVKRKLRDLETQERENYTRPMCLVDFKKDITMHDEYEKEILLLCMCFSPRLRIFTLVSYLTGKTRKFGLEPYMFSAEDDFVVALEKSAVLSESINALREILDQRLAPSQRNFAKDILQYLEQATRVKSLKDALDWIEQASPYFLDLQLSLLAAWRERYIGNFLPMAVRQIQGMNARYLNTLNATITQIAEKAHVYIEGGYEDLLENDDVDPCNELIASEFYKPLLIRRHPNGFFAAPLFDLAILRKIAPPPGHELDTILNNSAIAKLWADYRSGALTAENGIPLLRTELRRVKDAFDDSYKRDTMPEAIVEQTLQSLETFKAAYPPRVWNSRRDECILSTLKLFLIDECERGNQAFTLRRWLLGSKNFRIGSTAPAMDALVKFHTHEYIITRLSLIEVLSKIANDAAQRVGMPNHNIELESNFASSIVMCYSNTSILLKQFREYDSKMPFVLADCTWFAENDIAIASLRYIDFEWRRRTKNRVPPGLLDAFSILFAQHITDTPREFDQNMRRPFRIFLSSFWAYYSVYVSREPWVAQRPDVTNLLAMLPDLGHAMLDATCKRHKKQKTATDVMTLAIIGKLLFTKRVPLDTRQLRLRDFCVYLASYWQRESVPVINFAKLMREFDLQQTTADSAEVHGLAMRAKQEFSLAKLENAGNVEEVLRHKNAGLIVLRDLFTHPKYWSVYGGDKLSSDVQLVRQMVLASFDVYTVSADYTSLWNEFQDITSQSREERRLLNMFLTGEISCYGYITGELTPFDTEAAEVQKYAMMSVDQYRESEEYQYWKDVI